MLQNIKRQMLKVVLFLLAVIAIIVWAEVARSPEADTVNGLEVYFFDVGQGDVSLIQKDDYQILIDGGPSDAILAKLGDAMPLLDRKIEIIILSHPHADHLVGVNQVLERYDVGKIYSSGVPYTSNEYIEFLENVNSKNIDLIVPKIGDKTSYENIEVDFLWPGEKFVEEELENLNNSSVVIRACYLKNCSIFLGDLELDGQRMMFAELAEKNVNSEIIKIAHHGSSNGTDQRLLDIVMPNYAVILVGLDNKFDHPHDVTLDLLSTNNIETLRSDEGDIKFIISELGINQVK